MNDNDQKELEKLRAEKKARDNRELTLKVSEKGAVSLYGLGRFPVTLYKEQWEKVIPFIGKIESFIADHKGELKTKK